ncbi:hypothetical protein GCM10009780_55450 [Actinomadura alba]
MQITSMKNPARSIPAARAALKGRAVWTADRPAEHVDDPAQHGRRVPALHGRRGLRNGAGPVPPVGDGFEQRDR